MRQITSHIVNPVNDKLAITVLDEPGHGGASHEYRVSWDNGTHGGSSPISFQNGPIAEHGVNGITEAVLLAIVIDRLECFQAGPFASEDNVKALMYVRAAQEALFQRTRDRMSRGVEGKSVA